MNKIEMYPTSNPSANIHESYLTDSEDEYDSDFDFEDEEDLIDELKYQDMAADLNY